LDISLRKSDILGHKKHKILRLIGLISNIRLLGEVREKRKGKREKI
jgi:hypothetical protein